MVCMQEKTKGAGCMSGDARAFSECEVICCISSPNWLVFLERP